MQNDNNKNKFSDFFLKHVFDILFSIPSIIPFISWIKWIALKHQYTNLEILQGIIIVIITVMWFIIARNPKPYQKTQYKTLSKTITYQRHNDNSLSISRTIEIESNVNGLDRIKDRYLWTGKTDSGLPKKVKNVSSIHAEESIGIWKYFSVNFNQTINKGNKICVGYKWKNIPNCISSSPFVSTDTEYETKHILFEVKLGQEYANKEIILEEFRSIESEVPISSICTRLDEEGGYKWELNHPTRHRYFRVRWNWIDDDQCEEDA